MRRRVFLSTLTVPALQWAQDAAASEKIAAIEIWRYEGRRETRPGANRQHQVQPIHIYDEHRPKPYVEGPPAAQATQTISSIYLKIRTSGGLEGIYGPVDREAASVLDQQLRGFLMGKPALAIETIWDQMYRSNRHARSSHYMMALSAVDNCLWDLRGKYYKAPVYRLLGGPSRPEIDTYGSCLGFSVEPALVRKRCVELRDQGYRHQKWFLAYGPADGRDGLRKNVELVAALREALGDSVDIMFDAFMGWHLDYAIAWAKQVERYQPRWIEEAFPMDQLDSFVELRRATSVPVATGEHFYGRWEVNRFLRAGAISVVQADPEWCGGVSELMKMCTLASSYDAQVVPHGHNIHSALHVVAAQPPITCPLVEYLINKMASYYYFLTEPPVPVNGKLKISAAPGFGIEIDPAKVEKQTEVRWRT